MSLQKPGSHEPKYRIFISYSRKDIELASKIADILEGNGFKPMWDHDFKYGTGFHDQIKNFIAHSHVFLPVITPTSNIRNWVHQEIGYAMARNIPVLPVAAGRVPGEMIQQILAVQIGEDLEQLRNHLSRDVIANLVQHYSASSLALYQCADFAAERAALMAKYCSDVSSLGESALFRQKGGLSSLHIPNKIFTNPAWKARYGSVDRGPEHCLSQLKERQAIEVHVRTAGCKLIINPYLTYEKYGTSARITRLECLLEFLDSMPDEKCQVAINPNMDHDQSLTLLGDWFSAESVSAVVGQGYRQTIFTKHAPSMLSKLEVFDQEFDQYIEDSGWKAESSRTRAFSVLQEVVAELKKLATSM
jgi:hypothetical protein